MCFIIIVSILSCGDTTQQLNEHRSSQLQNIAEFGAQPLHQSFQNACTQLASDVKLFAENLNADNLRKVQKQWKEVGQLFKRCELYDIGDVNSSFIHFRIHRWPVNTARLQDTIQQGEPLTLEKMSNFGSALVGIAALEYLLFDEDTDTTLSLFQSEPRRVEYLNLATEYLAKQATELNSIWKKYQPAFVAALENEIAGGHNQMINSLVDFLETTSKLRIGKALTAEAENGVDPKRLEAYRSNASLDFIKSGFEEWKRCYGGAFANSPDQFGFDDYLKALGQSDLANRIQTAIKNCDVALTELSNLNQDLEAQTAQVTDLMNAFNQLSILMKTELATYLGVTVMVNDSDGD